MIKQVLKLSSLLLLLPFVCGCSSSSGDDAPFLEADFKVEDGIDRIYLTDMSKSGGKPTSVTWSSTGSVNISKGSDGRAYFLIPEGDAGGQVDVTMTVKSGNDSDQVTKSASYPALTLHRKYGLGVSLTKELSNDVPYEWYVDQGATGTYSRINCGPACTEMVLHWADPFTTVTTESLRDDSGETGWWSTNTIQAAVKAEGASCEVINFTSFTNLRTELDAGNIAILCLDIYYVKETDIPEWRKDKYYKTSGSGSGHFIIVKGYKEVDGKVLAECYDPWSLGVKYPDGQLKGKDRYYRMEDLIFAADDWWKYAIVVSEKGSEVRAGTRSSSYYLDPTTIPVGYGG